MPPSGALFSACREEHLEGRIGEYKGAHIAPVSDQPGGPAERPLTPKSASRTGQAPPPSMRWRHCPRTGFPGVTSSPSELRIRSLPSAAEANQTFEVPATSASYAAASSSSEMPRRTAASATNR